MHHIIRTTAIAAATLAGATLGAVAQEGSGPVLKGKAAMGGWQQDIVHTILGRRAPEKEIAPLPPSLSELETPPTGLRL